MLLYRVFPYIPGAPPGAPGHPLYVNPDQGQGRWDNPTRYLAMYAAATPSGAVGETFAGLSEWNAAMLPFPSLPGSVRGLGTYVIDEEQHPVLDLDSAKVLLKRGLRPTDVVIRNRPRTQQIARDAFNENAWSGLSWWSMHRPQWGLFVYWNLDTVQVERVEALPGHAAVSDAARLLGKRLAPDLT